MQRTKICQLTLIAAATFLAMACDDLGKDSDSKTSDSQNTASGTSNVLSQRQFVAAYQILACQSLERCCKEFSLGYDADQCATLQANAGAGTSPNATASFNPSFAEQCLIQMKTSTDCGANINVPACGSVYSGSTQPGNACASNADCAVPAGAYATSCDLILGVCVAAFRGRANQGCQFSCLATSTGDMGCTWGPVSSVFGDGSIVVSCFANDGLTCGDQGQCVALGKSGDPCVSNDNCSLDLYCDTSLGNFCRPRRAVNESCDEYAFPCVTTAYCSSGVCKGKKANGQACLSVAECQGTCICGATGDCASEGICKDSKIVRRNINAAISSALYCTVATATE